MVDAGLGPIAGVPESGEAPRTSYSPNVLPASSVEVAASGGGSSAGASPGGTRNFSPITAAPSPAPMYIDGIAGKRTYSSDPEFDEEEQQAQAGPGGRRQPPQQRQQPVNPLPTATDDDLILPPGVSRENARAAVQAAGGQGGGQGVRTPPAFPGDDYYAVNATYGDSALRAPNMPNPSLGSAREQIPNSDLVDLPGYGGGYGQGGYSAPRQQQQQPQYGGGYGGGYGGAPRSSGGWSFGDDLR